MSDWDDGFSEGYAAGWMSAMRAFSGARPTGKYKGSKKTAAATSPSRKAMPKDGYHAKYGRAFKRLAPKYKKKGGGWKKNGFKRCAAAARRVAKK